MKSSWRILNKNLTWKVHGEDNVPIRTVTWTLNDFRGWLLGQRWPLLSCRLWPSFSFKILLIGEQSTDHLIWPPMSYSRIFSTQCENPWIATGGLHFFIYAVHSLYPTFSNNTWKWQEPTEHSVFSLSTVTLLFPPPMSFGYLGKC